MGPRSIDRGNGRLVVTSAWTFERLQWGRDLLIAEIPLWLMPYAGAPALQWGRDLLIAETNACHAPALAVQRLQWGRDLLIAEISARPTIILEKQKASMGPRSIDRGNAVHHGELDTTGTVLQWGRDLLIAETPARWMRLHGIVRFNGAAIY